MVRLTVSIAVALASLPLRAQSPGPQQIQLHDVLPAAIRTTQIALTPDARRVYYSDSARAIWLYGRVDKRNVRIAGGEAWDLTLSPTGNAIAYAKPSAGSSAHHIWLLPLDSRTGLAAGPERRASAMQGDAPSISADGKWLAFAHDDTVGVAQSVVVVPVAGGRERTIVPFLPGSVSNIRWSPDGRSLYFGVNPPVACDPEWSCLPLAAQFKQTMGSVRRAGVNGGSSEIVTAKVGNGWPGLSADGSLLAYSDTGYPRRVIVADTSGRVLHSFALRPRQTVEGWLNAATLVFSDRGDIRRLRGYSLVDGTSRVLVESLDPLPEPAGSPDGQLISTIHCADEGCELHLATADGSPRKVVVLPDRFGGGNLWSPDQRWIAYIGGPPNAERHVNLVDVASGRVVPLLAIRSNVASLLWLPDSRGVILSTVAGSNGAARRAVFQRVDLDGTVHAFREFVIGATPSAGTAIDATTAVLLLNGGLTRVVFDGDSSSTPILPPSDAHVWGSIAMSAGHERLAIRRSRDSKNSELNVVEVVTPDGSDHVTIELPFQMLNAPSGLRFLPGGAQFVVFGGPYEQEHNIGVYLVTVATQSVKKLFTIPPGSFNGELAVTPDGRTVMYVSNETATPRVFTMDLSSLLAGARR